MCSMAGLCLAGSAFQTIGKDLLKVTVSFFLLFKAGSVEAARSYLLPGVAMSLRARLTTTDRLSGGGAWKRRDENVSQGMKFKGGGGRITGQAVTPALRSTRLSLLHRHGQSGWSCWVSCHAGCWVPHCRLWLLLCVCPGTDGRAEVSWWFLSLFCWWPALPTDCLWALGVRVLILFAFNQKLLLGVVYIWV